ncbi:Cdc6/Cdc18 family protein [Effusibacillus pohliae]|uniref:hypothetical protein n=1 Tax=Effusibacillus pohliae TaxID=232270 RepID=UPI000368CE9C|nr:hypothetical protein [Effusibacillus pohliae]
MITEWMAWQPKHFYTSTWEECLQDIHESVEYVYRKNLTLQVEPRDLTVSFAEIDAIIRQCPQKNQKALAYALLIHSKRWAGENGVFYMIYVQMKEATGMDEVTVWRQLKNLEALGVIEIVARNQSRKGTHLKRPNYYRMTLKVEDVGGDKLFSLEEGRDLSECLKYFYDEKQLKQLIPRRQYDALVA